jgi:methylaspartate mutase epsilon subunit
MAIPSNSTQLDGFDESRHQILAQDWCRDLDPIEVCSYLANLNPDRFASSHLHRSHDRPYIQPRGGFPTFNKQQELTTALDQAGADFIPLTIDSLTRHNDFDKAAYALERSEEAAVDYLNGYPLVNHGYALTRQLYRDIDKPISLRHGTPDARVLVEIAIAAGIMEIEGGGLTYNLPYSERFPIDKSILYWQYVDRLCASYSTPGRVVHRESFGPLTATMVPPMMVAVIELIELMLAAEQGVKSFSVSFGQTGNIDQDIALGRVLLEKGRSYLEQFGFADVNLYLVYHQWMGAFPAEGGRARYLIALAAMISQFVGADKVVAKTRYEALGVPTIDANLESVQEIKYLFDIFPRTGVVHSEAITRETELISSQVEYAMQAIFNLPGDAFWESVYQAFCKGFIDVPFSPHRQNANKMLTLRDNAFGIRIKEPGAVPMQAADLILEGQLLERNTDKDLSIVQKMQKDINLMAAF